MDKGCCFIGTIEDRNFAVEREHFLAVLSAFLFRLTFLEGVKRYYFPYREALYCSANRLLEPIVFGAAEVKRVLLYLEGESGKIPFPFYESHRFEEREEISREKAISREALYRAAIDRSEYCVFYLDPKATAPDEIAAWEYARTLKKRTIDLFGESDPRALFTL